jgi:hypothetical protein
METASQINGLKILSPKRRASPDKFLELYPYYAGYPEAFVKALFDSSAVAPGSWIYDPWNGTGTTTSVASSMGLSAIGFDLNPVMVMVAKARLLPTSEAASLIPLASAILRQSRSVTCDLTTDEPLLTWFKPATAKKLRSIERSCFELLIGPEGKVGATSSIAATFYTALFTVGRQIAHAFRSANPTWIRDPKAKSDRASLTGADIEARFLKCVSAIAAHVAARAPSAHQAVACEVRVADATTTTPGRLVDWVVTSPPYCTRIDYAISTRVELALLQPLSGIDTDHLRSRMIGTTKVPSEAITPSDAWGARCNEFLSKIYDHKSKASKTYYYSNHLDYFDKLNRSVSKLSSALRSGGTAILIVQDSYYKDLHNDLPGIVSEMAEGNALTLKRRADFVSSTCMSRINTRAAAHLTRRGSTEAVLCFTKQ